MSQKNVTTIERKDRFDVGFTIITTDDWLTSKLEPKAPNPSKRMDALRKISSEGVETWIFLGPIIPMVNDTPYHWLEILDLAEETRSTVYYDKLNLRPYVYQALEPFLANHSPQSLKILKNRREEAKWVLRTSKILENMCREKNIRCRSVIKNL